MSIVKSEETKVRQEDLSKLLYEVQLLRTQQDNMECQMQDMKQWVHKLSMCGTCPLTGRFKGSSGELQICDFGKEIILIGSTIKNDQLN